MFPKRFFPARFFAGRYWPPASSGGWPAATSLGRFRVGEKVRIAVAIVPDAAFVGTIYPETETVAPVQFSPNKAGGMTALLTIEGFSALGTFEVRATAIVGGVSQKLRYSFEIVGGGDTGGRVIALAAASRPGGTHVLAHLESGKIVEGRNARA